MSDQPGILNIQADDITLGELESLKADGITLADIEAGDLSAVLGLTLLVLRRTNPAATMDDARAIKLGQLKPGRVAEDPTMASSSTPHSTRTSSTSARRNSRA